MVSISGAGRFTASHALILLPGGCAACAPPWQSHYPATYRYSSRVDGRTTAFCRPGGGPQPQPNRGARRGHPHPHN